MAKLLVNCLDSFGFVSPETFVAAEEEEEATAIGRRKIVQFNV